MSDKKNTLTLGLIINPWAGIGGQVALKGSDGVLDEALALGAKSRVKERVLEFLQALTAVKSQIRFLSFPGSMGADLLQEQGFEFDLIASSTYNKQQASNKQANSNEAPISLSFSVTTSALDTQEAALKMANLGAELVVFAGGDGTARDIASVLSKTHNDQVCLGIPTGVKIQSGVYAQTPRSAARLVEELVSGTGLNLQRAEVRDIDEQALRQGQVKSTRYAELLVPSFPDQGLALQGSKLSTSQSIHAAGAAIAANQEQNLVAEQLAAEEIAACLLERSEDNQGQLLIVGPGKTTHAFKQRLHPDKSSLLGVDVYFKGSCLLSDATEQELIELVDNPDLGIESLGIVVSLIGGQGCVLGRGNQQLSHRLVSKVLNKSGKDAITIVATPAKLEALQGKNLFVDTGSLQLDLALQGLCKVLVDYEHEMLCYIKNLMTVAILFSDKPLSINPKPKQLVNLTQ